MMCIFLTIALVLQGMFHNGGWVEISLQNKEEDKVLFCIPRRYYESHTDTHGHGTMIGYDLVGSETHIVYSRAINAELEIESWTANRETIADSKIVKKGIREGIYWRSDAFIKDSGEIVFTLFGYGKDSLEINHILDSAHIDKANEQAYWEDSCEKHRFLKKPILRLHDKGSVVHPVNQIPIDAAESRKFIPKE